MITVQKKTDYILPAALFVLLILLYNTFKPDISFQHWDSICYGWEAENQGLEAIWGNHPLGHVILNSAFIIAKQIFGWTGRALTIFQLVNSLFSCLTILFFYLALRSLTQLHHAVSLGLSLLLGVSFSFWHYTMTGDIYIIAFMLALLTWVLFIKRTLHKSDVSIIIPGLFWGLAILAHQLNCIFAVPALIIILGCYGFTIKALKKLIEFFIAAGITVICGYLCFGILVTHSFSLPLIADWLKGYFGNSQYGNIENFNNFHDTLRIFIFTILYSSENLIVKIFRNILFLLVVLPLAGYLFYFKKLEKSQRLLLLASVAQIVIMGLLIQWWEPLNPKFWMLTIVPFIMLLADIIPSCENAVAEYLQKPRFTGIKKLCSYYFLLLAGLVLVFNLGTGIIPQTKPNPAFNAAVNQWVNNTDRNDLLITMGSLVPHLRYYYDRRHTVHPYNYLLRSSTPNDTFAYLRRRIDATINGGFYVYYAPMLAEYLPRDRMQNLGITKDDINNFFAGYISEPAFAYYNLIDGKLTPVRRITGMVNE